MTTLQTVLDTMNVPVNRKNDLRWLLRNLGVRNSTNPQFNAAIALIRAELEQASNAASPH